MATFSRIMVGLDFTEMDQTLINYTANICALMNVEKVYFVHVAKCLDCEEDFEDEFGDIEFSIDEKLSSKMEKEVNKVFKKDIKTEVNFEVIEGSPLEEMVHRAKVKKIDLFITGRKSEEKGSGLIPSKLARALNIKMLFVPQNAKLNIRKILVPVDFSEYSKLALKHSIDWANEFKDNIDIVAYHVYFVPIGYYKSGKSYLEFADILLGHAKDRLNKLTEDINEHGFKITQEFKLDDRDDPAKQIQKYAIENSVDLIITGAKGQTAASVFILGSVTEKLLKYLKEIPVLILKKKDEKLGVLDALFGQGFY